MKKRGGGGEEEEEEEEEKNLIISKPVRKYSMVIGTNFKNL